MVVSQSRLHHFGFHTQRDSLTPGPVPLTVWVFWCKLVLRERRFSLSVQLLVEPAPLRAALFLRQVVQRCPKPVAKVQMSGPRPGSGPEPPPHLHPHPDQSCIGQVWLAIKREVAATFIAGREYLMATIARGV